MQEFSTAKNKVQEIHSYLLAHCSLSQTATRSATPFTERLEKNAARPPLECRECDSRLFRQRSCIKTSIHTWRLRKAEDVHELIQLAMRRPIQVTQHFTQEFTAVHLQLHLSGSHVGRTSGAVTRDTDLTMIKNHKLRSPRSRMRGSCFCACEISCLPAPCANMLHLQRGKPVISVFRSSCLANSSNTSVLTR